MNFDDVPPAAADDSKSDTDAAARGAYHSAEIEFVWGAGFQASAVAAK
jgi:hypothetical protein